MELSAFFSCFFVSCIARRMAYLVRADTTDLDRVSILAQARIILFLPLVELPFLAVRIIFCGYFCFLAFSFSLFFVSLIFPVSMCLVYWRAYGVRVVSSAMARHCIVNSLYELLYDLVLPVCRSFVTTELVSL